MKERSLVGICCFLFSVSLLLLFPACKKEVKAPAEKVINVRVQPVEMQTLRPFVDTIGTLHPYDEVIVSAEVEGVLKDVRVNEGTIVFRGMVLASVDDTDYALEVKRAEALLKQMEATLANTRVEHQRKSALYKEELVTKQQLDDVSTRLSLADAELERAKAALAIAREKSRKTKVYSPLSGVVKEKKVSAGDYVKSGTNLFSIIQNNPLKLKFTVTEKHVAKPVKGQDVLFTIDAYPGKQFKGNVSTIYPSLEEKTRALMVEALVPNAEGLLKPGVFSHVTLYTGAARDTIVVPITSLLYEEERVKVFIVEDDRAKARPVKLGSKYGEVMEILEGLQKGETIVIVGQHNLSDNTKVNIAQSESDQQKAGSSQPYKEGKSGKDNKI